MLKLLDKKMRRAVFGLFFLTIFTGYLDVARAAEISGTLTLGGDKTERLISNVNVTLYEATESAPIYLGSMLTDDEGNFSFESDVDTTESIFYLTADVRKRVQFVAVLGPKLPEKATINELTTVASSYSMAQFYRSGQISGSSFALNIAAMMNDNIVNSETGETSSVLLDSPNADQTNSLRMTRSLSNLLNRCARQSAVAGSLRRLTRIHGEPAPENTAVALANLARNPGNKAERIYRLAKRHPVFTPALEEEPDAWTVTVKVNHSGNDDTMQFGGPANVAFDSRGYAWIPNNVPQGSPNSGDYLIVLKPNGQPADGTNGGPLSPITGGGIYGGGWGVAIDARDQVWVSNFGWGGSDYYPSETPHGPIGNGTGSVSLVQAEDGTVLSNPDGFFGGVWRAQAIQVDAAGNVWIASFENDSVVVYKNGDPNDSVSLKQYSGARPFGLAISPDGSAWVANSGGLAGQFSSSLAKVKLNAFGELEHMILLPIGDTLKTVVSDSLGNAWLASQGNDTVYAISPEGDVLGAFTGGGIKGPWGLTVDGEGNIWISNFGPLEKGSDFTDGRISKICGSNPNSWPRRKEMGDPLSPDTGYTVPSAGEQVLLVNNQPLYGPDGPPSYSPIMRQTSLQIDAAGNIWTVNNWKPDFDVDTEGGNPGGDGVIIFVGLAPPPL